MDKYTFIKLHAFNKVLKHLSEAKRDPRKREQMRANVALGKINSWIREGEKIYEKRQKQGTEMERQEQEV